MEEQQSQLHTSGRTLLNLPTSIFPGRSTFLIHSILRTIKPGYSGFQTHTFSSFNWNGDFNLTPKWKMGLNGYYDITTHSIQSLTMFLSREMHCWMLSINVTPVGLYRSFNITINPRSGLLRDLRVNRSRYFYTQ
jgi:hypothetical protein